MTLQEIKKLSSKDLARHYLDSWQPKRHPNIKTQVWGTGKATLWPDKSICLDKDSTGKQNYPGNCDNCRYFMGCDFKKPLDKYMWGDIVPACCGLLLEEEK